MPSTGAAQARNFLRVLPPAPGGLPPAVDLELSGNCSHRPSLQSAAAQLSDFLRLVQHSTRQTVVVYLGSDFAHHYPLALYTHHPLWLRSILRRPAGNWTIWQVDGQAHIGGITTDVDLDVGRPRLHPPSLSPATSASARPLLQQTQPVHGRSHPERQARTHLPGVPPTSHQSASGCVAASDPLHDPPDTA